MPRRRPYPAPASQRERVGLAAPECLAIDVPVAGPDLVRLLTGSHGQPTLLDSTAGPTLSVQWWASATCETWERRESGTQPDLWAATLLADATAYAVCEPGGPAVAWYSSRDAAADLVAALPSPTGWAVREATVADMLAGLLAAGGVRGRPWWYATGPAGWCVAALWESALAWLDVCCDLRGVLYRVPVVDFVARAALPPGTLYGGINLRIIRGLLD